MKKFVMKGMQTTVTMEERVKRLSENPLPGVKRQSLDLYYNGIVGESRAYTARLEMWIDQADGTLRRVFHARCVSFEKALEQVQLYENGLIAGKQFIENPEVSEFKDQDVTQQEHTGPGSGPFETRAEFTTFTDVISKFFSKGGDFGPRLVADLPRLRHGMAVAVPLKRDGEVKWVIDWFDYARLAEDGKGVFFICINDAYHSVFPLDPYISSSIDEGKPVPSAYRLWLKKTTSDVKAALNGDKEKVYKE